MCLLWKYEICSCQLHPRVWFPPCPQAVVNEDTSGDAAVLRAENKRLKSELVLARQLIQHSSAHATGQTAAELEEQQAQLQQALTMLVELGDRNSELEDALEYSKG
eukprot:GHUV01027965.1.p1 GENE.GHUV01027965.1~~GHUV01027965.1.p1  ORF type:complete len:106 (+),score=38.77 GHUV01027965.1:992-1309(+)